MQLGVINAQQNDKRGLLMMVVAVDALGLRRPTDEVRWLQCDCAPSRLNRGARLEVTDVRGGQSAKEVLSRIRMGKWKLSLYRQHLTD